MCKFKYKKIAVIYKCHIYHINIIMKTKSFLKKSQHIFVVENFAEIEPYIKYLSVENKYYFIITLEKFELINKINENLTNSNKHFVTNESVTFVGTLEKHVKWCSELNLLCISTIDLENEIKIKYENIFDSKYIPKEIEKPDWVFEDKALIDFYYEDPEIKILIVESIDQNWHLLNKYTNNMYIFIIFPTAYDKNKFEFVRNAIYSQNKNLNLKNIIMMVPNLDYALLSMEYEFSYIFMNNNCLLDENIFKNENNVEVIYDCVLNCRPEKWKRPFLAKNVINLAIIKGYNFRKNDYYELEQLNPKYINNKRLEPAQVNKIYNQSHCGGIFSAAEGACYSSSEYLLAGLPVISTKSTGGRDVWYNKDNSIIIEPTENEVVNAIELCKFNLKNGIFNRNKIRNDHVELSNKMRNFFINYVQTIFDKHKIKINSKEYWNTHYNNKLRKTHKLNEVLNKLNSQVIINNN